MQEIFVFLLAVLQTAWVISTNGCKCKRHRAKRVLALAISTVLALLSTVMLFVSLPELRYAVGIFAVLNSVSIFVYTMALMGCGCIPSSVVGYFLAITSLMISVMVLFVREQPPTREAHFPAAASPPGYPTTPGPVLPYDAGPALSPDANLVFPTPGSRVIHVEYISNPTDLAREIGYERDMSESNAREVLKGWYAQDDPQYPPVGPRRGGGGSTPMCGGHHKFGPLM